jgi:hypothetical protein
MNRLYTIAVRLTWFFLLLVFAQFLAGLHFRTNIEYFRATLEQLKDFSAIAPFQLRVLTPGMVWLMERFFSIDYREAFYYLETLGWFLILVAAPASLVMLEAPLSRRAKNMLGLTISIPLLLVTCLPFREYRAGPYEQTFMPLFYYPYDIYSALFALLQFLLIFRLSQRWNWKDFCWYGAVFTLASVNRETQIFFIFYFTAVLWRVCPRKRLAAAVFVQIAIFTLVRTFITILFDHGINPDAMAGGTPYELHAEFNLVFLMTHYFGSVVYVLSVGGAALAGFLAFRRLTPFLKISLLAYGLPLFLAIIFIGYLHETRVFLEVMPLLWLAAMQGLRTVCQEPHDEAKD